jgi:hypothetical protein
MLVFLPFLVKSSSHSVTHCSLSHFAEPDSPNLQKTKRLVSHTKDFFVVRIPSNRLEVMAYRAYHGEYPMSQTNHYDSYPSPDAQLTDSSRELGSDDNVEGRDEKQ